MGGVVVELGEYLGVVLEDHHFEVEGGDEDGDGVVEAVADLLQLAPYVFLDEVAQLELVGPA